MEMKNVRNWRELLEDMYVENEERITSKRPVENIDHLGQLTGKARTYIVNGKEVDFYTIGQLASALGRRAVTIRKWESDGVIPVAQFSAPSDDPRGRRRLYTREQVEGIVKIAEEEGILYETWRAINKTQFTSRVILLFEELASEGH